MDELNTQEYLSAGGDLALHDKDLLSAEHLFFYRLGRMVEIGMPVLSSLRFLVRETTHAELKTALQEIAQSIEGGDTLSGSMDRPVFTPSTIVMVKVGEVTGELDRALVAIADCMAKQLAI